MTRYDFLSHVPRTGRRSATVIRLSPAGFRLPRDFLKAYHQDGATAVTLFYDRVRRAIGFKFFRRRHEGVYPLRDSNGARRFSARGFYKVFGIDPTRCAGPYEPKPVKGGSDGELIAIHLEDRPPRPSTRAVSAVTSSSKRAWLSTRTPSRRTSVSSSARSSPTNAERSILPLAVATSSTPVFDS